ncbi:MAG: SPOR domain-containing protein [Alphaproteobacteria bacterium]|nr:SPOR domain-containing protein [Alphaproteobacteria bacterium SS10]
MAQYISDRDLAALAQLDGQDDGDGGSFDDGSGGEGPILSPRVVFGVAAATLAVCAVVWFSYGRGGGSDVPLITADTTPVKIRPASPGGLEIPFQDMALYDRLSGQPQPVNPTLMPAAEAPQTALTQPVEPVEPIATAQPTQAPAATVASGGEGESLFAAAPTPAPTPEPVSPAPETQPVELAPAPQPAVLAEATQVTAVQATLPAPTPDAVTVSAGDPRYVPVPVRHPQRASASASPQQIANSFIAAPQVATPGEPRRIRRGTIATPEIPLATVQQGLQLGGALGDSDDQGNLVYRNSVSQNSVAPQTVVNAPEGEVEIVLQTESNAGQAPAVTVNPAQVDRQADGTIEIRSPDRDIVTIRSAPDVAEQAAEAPPTPGLIPRPPQGAVGPSQVASLPRETTATTSTDLANINTLPPAARAPAPVSRGITRGSVVNQRASAPGPAQPPVTEPAPTTTAAAATAAPPAPPTGEGWRVQLASVGSQDAAIREWRRYQRAHTDLLGNLDLKVQRADLGDRGVFYRVQAGVLDRGGASALCETLKSRGTDCLIKRD